MHVTSRADDGAALSRPCEHCSADNAASARFCKQCGSALLPPPACPACQAKVTGEARFCASCGLKLVGLRPAASGAARSEGPAAKPVAAVAPAAAPKVSAPAPEPDDDDAPAPTAAPSSDDARRELESLAASLPRAKPRSSNILGNVLLFVAALSVFVVVMYKVNLGAPKETSPFMGGPPPAMGGGGGGVAQEQPAAGGGAAQAGGAESGGPVRGVVKIAKDLQGAAPSGGALFVIVRVQGMPDKGPPVAVKRIESPSFPAQFEVGPSDVMMQGLGFLGPFDLYVRLDADGNAMTKQPGDLTTMKSGVNAGATDLEIVLDKRL